MAVEKFIAGKHDSGHHEGKRSEMRRIDEANDELLDKSEIEEVEYDCTSTRGSLFFPRLSPRAEPREK